MKPIFVIHQDRMNSEYFIVTRREDEILEKPQQFRFIREFKSLSLAFLERNRLQKIRDLKTPDFLQRQAS
jgi:hypothetical protein